MHLLPILNHTPKFVMGQIKMINPDILRRDNPKEYKVAVSEQVFNDLHNIWQAQAPIQELR